MAEFDDCYCDGTDDGYYRCPNHDTAGEYEFYAAAYHETGGTFVEHPEDAYEPSDPKLYALLESA